MDCTVHGITKSQTRSIFTFTFTFLYSCLRHPRNQEAWQATVHEVAKELETTHTHTHTHTRAKEKLTEKKRKYPK